MDSRQEAKLNMYRTVQLFCNNNNAITATNPAFTTAFAAFTAKISNIISTATSESQVITGIATDKTVLKKNLCQSATDIAALIFAYASSINNNTLKQEVNYAYSDFFRLKDDLLAPTAKNIHNAATANLPALAPFGVTAAMLSALQTTINAYSTSVPTPRNAKAIKATYTANIKQLIKETDSILKNQLDKLAVSFKTTQPDFYNSYLNTRIIIDPSKTETQIKGTVVQEGSNTPIIKAAVNLAGPTGGSTQTDTAGKFIFKPVIPGNYQIKVSAEGYTSTDITFDVKLGQAVNQVIALTKN